MQLDATITIARPIEVVYAYVIDVSNDVHWRTGITESGLYSDEPVGIDSIGYARVGDVG